MGFTAVPISNHNITLVYRTSIMGHSVCVGKHLIVIEPNDHRYNNVGRPT